MMFFISQEACTYFYIDVGLFHPNLGAHAPCGSQEHINKSFYKRNLSWGIKLQQLKFGHLSEEQFDPLMGPFL